MKPKLKTKNTTFWVIWNPTYPKPPTVRFDSRQQALNSAKYLAERNPQEVFYVLQGVDEVKTRVPVEVVSLGLR